MRVWQSSSGGASWQSAPARCTSLETSHRTKDSIEEARRYYEEALVGREAVEPLGWARHHAAPVRNDRGKTGATKGGTALL